MKILCSNAFKILCIQKWIFHGQKRGALTLLLFTKLNFGLAIKTVFIIEYVIHWIVGFGAFRNYSRSHLYLIIACVRDLSNLGQIV